MITTQLPALSYRKNLGDIFFSKNFLFISRSQERCGCGHLHTPSKISAGVYVCGPHTKIRCALDHLSEHISRMPNFQVKKLPKRDCMNHFSAYPSQSCPDKTKFC